MKHISVVAPAGAWNATSAVDVVELDATDRQRRRVVLVGEEGATYLLNLSETRQLREGDGLVLEDGSIVRVAAKPESLIEITAPDAPSLARFAWHIGNRHTDVLVVGVTLRIRRDHVLRALGAILTPIEAPFDPEPGAYSAHGRKRD